MSAALAGSKIALGALGEKWLRSVGTRSYHGFGLADAMGWSTYPIEDLTTFQIEAWHQLHSQAKAWQSPFTTPGFCQAANKVRRDVHVAILENHGRIQAILPFERSYRFVPSIGSKPGGHLSDCFGVVGSAGGRTFSEQEILNAAKRSVLSFDHVPLQQNGLFPISRGAVSRGLRVEMSDFDGYLANLRNADKKFVKEVERHTSQLVQRYGPIQFHWQSTQPGSELERLIDHKRSQYFKFASRDALKPSWARNLLAELVQAQHKNCEAILSTLYCGDQWVASNLSLRAGRMLHIWFPVFNRDLRRFGPGHILFFKLFETAAAHGVRVVDFGGGVAAYKRRYAGQEYLLFKGCLRQFDVVSTAHRMAQSVNWRIQPIVSKWARGSGR